MLENKYIVLPIHKKIVLSNVYSLPLSRTYNMTYILKVVDLQFIIMPFSLIFLNIEIYGQVSINTFLQNIYKYFPISYYFQKYVQFFLCSPKALDKENHKFINKCSKLHL